jgi:hypothetical protein
MICTWAATPSTPLQTHWLRVRPTLSACGGSWLLRATGGTRAARSQSSRTEQPSASRAPRVAFSPRASPRTPAPSLTAQRAVVTSGKALLPRQPKTAAESFCRMTTSRTGRGCLEASSLLRSRTRFGSARGADSVVALCKSLSRHWKTSLPLLEANVEESGSCTICQDAGVFLHTNRFLVVEIQILTLFTRRATGAQRRPSDCLPPLSRAQRS